MPAPEAAALREELLQRMRAGAGARLPDPEFDGLALAVFDHQFRDNAPYQAYCRSRGATPETVKHWTEVPAVPTSAFKVVPLVCGDPADAQAVFRTSGTTDGPERRGEHFVPDLTLYHAALRAGFAAHLLPDRARLPMISLVPPPGELPDSSLAHMVAEVLAEFGAPGSAYYIDTHGIHSDRLLETLRETEAQGQPVCVLGTSFALVHLLDALRERSTRVSLPSGSRLMDTGGFKGRSREVTREDLYGMVGESLGIPPDWCVNEYGMTEMGSQFYDAVAGEPEAAALSARLHRGPAWVRTRAVDPESLALLPDGQVGILRHWDLANLNSVMALQTEDLGVCEPEGFRLLGRATDAAPRGCSIAMDDLLSAVRRARRP